MSGPTPPPRPPDPLPLRWAVIFLGALVGGLLVGSLTFLQTTSWPATLLAALGTFGATVPALHTLLGPADDRRS
ncbi:hypothetical protein GA0115240_14422 [Streptomyces sp. DvalAA-14]|uniref:hypothetical protein n=1 Tax=unclassified Streptomyces TaxID=2593676 RepID=UPI00081B26C1|nr:MULTISPECIES: hypothetical protein [unclassified Streptomyces]MYS22726.1 hypothetical protein [Streptomyces sp. SID4948]SCE21400.1 hypothetical protein GA0115240_14422 [Streptomyces sp. DvalAA-14]